jgi:hypothetical protein
MRRIVLCGLVRLLRYFSTLSPKLPDFREEFIEHKLNVLILSIILSVIFIILIRTQPDIVINAYRSSCKVPAIPVTILINHEYSQHIFEKYTNIKFYGNPSSGSRVVPYGRTDRQ